MRGKQNAQVRSVWRGKRRAQERLRCRQPLWRNHGRLPGKSPQSWDPAPGLREEAPEQTGGPRDQLRAQGPDLQVRGAPDPGKPRRMAPRWEKVGRVLGVELQPPRVRASPNLAPLQSVGPQQLNQQPISSRDQRGDPPHPLPPQNFLLKGYPQALAPPHWEVTRTMEAQAKQLQQLQQGPYQTSGPAEAHFLWAARVQQSPPSPAAAPVLPVTLLQTVPALLLQNLPP